MCPGTAPEPVLDPRAALVRWPNEADRRAELGAAGVPCLLVVEPGTPHPPLGPGEDWVSLASDERDVAARLEQLARVRRAPSLALPPLAPEGLGADEHRAAARLIASVGRFVPAADLETDDPAALVRSIEPALRSAGYSVTVVEAFGFLLERAEPTPP